MIKNDIQLRRAENKLREISEDIQRFQGEYPRGEREFFILPLMDEEEDLKREIEEYRKLKELSLEEAIINGPLDRPHLIDNIGELLAKLRIASKLTQEELANLLGWEQPNLSRFESENYSSQTVAKIVEFASALGVYLHVTPWLFDVPEKSLEIVFRRGDYRAPKWRTISTSPEFTGSYPEEGSDIQLEERSKRTAEELVTA